MSSHSPNPPPPRLPTVLSKPRKVPEKVTPARLKHWTFAGFLLTYWCNARCAFCYVYSGPNKKGPLMSVAQALALWRGLNKLLKEDGLKEDGGPARGVRAGQPFACRIHFAGGEPFYNFQRMLDIAHAAQAEGLQVFEKVETNAFWAQDEIETRRRIEQLRDAGMTMLAISADVYHQEFVPVERCKLAARIAREVMGDEGVRVRWWDSLEVEVDVKALPEAERKQVFTDALVRHKDRLLGRAADALVDYYEGQPPEYFKDEKCQEATLGSRHVHIDGYGNVFPGVCSGIVWGRVTPPPMEEASSVIHLPVIEATEISPPGPAVTSYSRWPERFDSIEALWRFAAENWSNHPVIGRVVAGGSYRLYEYALTLGFVARGGGYASKCHLCHEIRRWLWQKAEFGSTLGPAEVYLEELD